MPLDEDNYPDPLVSRPQGSGTAWRVIALAAFFIAVAVAFSLFGDRIPAEWMLLALGALAVVGVFCLFALAAGLFRYAGAEDRRTLSQAVLDTLPYGLVIADRNGKIAFVNAEYGTFPGSLSNGVPVGVARLFAGHPEIAEAIYRLSRAAKDGRTAREDVRLIGGLAGSADGKPRWYRASVRPLPAVDGARTPLVAWTVEEITRDHEQQENVFLELQRAIDYLDHAPAGFFTADAQGRIQYLNSTLCDWLGYDLAAFQSGTINLNEIVRGDGANLLMGGRDDGEIRTETIDIDLVRRNGTSLPVRLLHRAARLADGELGETRTLVLDRSRGTDGDEDLRAAEVRFSRFFNDTPFAIATLDAAGRIIRTNAPFSRIFDWRGGEQTLEMHPMASLVAEDALGALRQAVEDAIAGKSEIEPIDVRLAGTSERAVRLYVSGSEVSEGEPEQVNIYALDMTDQRKLEQQFAQAKKMEAVGQLAGGIAHDFNNVLTAIIGFSDLLLLKHKPGDDNFNDLMAIKHSANRAAGLTRQLLAYSRRQTLRPQVLKEISNNIDDLNVILKRLTGEKIRIEIDHGRDVWPIKADLVELERVVVNLVVNARDAMPDGGKITIRTTNITQEQASRLTFTGMVPADYVLIEVEDTGTGMPPEVLEKIFEPFFTTKEMGKGTGLGLSTVYGIIKQSGGYIYPVSTVGVGTTFKIFLPRYVPTEAELAQLNASTVLKDLTGQARILLVEDEENVRRFSARALAATGHEVFEAESGEEALEILEDLDYKLDLMISDVVMPEMDGPTLLTEVRKRAPDLKVIFVSGYAEGNVRKDIEDNRSVEFLPKPYSLDQINSKVKEVLWGEASVTVN